jgi:hypothetical protein
MAILPVSPGTTRKTTRQNRRRRAKLHGSDATPKFNSDVGSRNTHRGDQQHVAFDLQLKLKKIFRTSKEKKLTPQ